MSNDSNKKPSVDNKKLQNAQEGYIADKLTRDKFNEAQKNKSKQNNNKKSKK